MSNKEKDYLSDLKFIKPRIEEVFPQKKFWGGITG